MSPRHPLVPPAPCVLCGVPTRQRFCALLKPRDLPRIEGVEGYHFAVDAAVCVAHPFGSETTATVFSFLERVAGLKLTRTVENAGEKLIAALEEAAS